MNIAIVGAGIIGITNAIWMLEKGHQVTVFTEDDYLSTNSDVAVALWWPSSQPLLNKLCMRSLQKFFELSLLKGSGVKIISSSYYFKTEAELHASIWHKKDLQEWLSITIEPVEKYIQDQGYHFSIKAQLPLMDVNLYRPYLFTKFTELGGKLIIKKIPALEDPSKEYDYVINCSGWKAKFLTDDNDVHPIRGQVEVVKVATDFLPCNSLNFPDRNSYIIFRPQSQDCVIGTTYQPHDICETPRTGDKVHILEKISPLFPQINLFNDSLSKVGFRCGRSDVRIAMDNKIIHCYGHRGSGYSASWGSADYLYEKFYNYVAAKSTRT